MRNAVLGLTAVGVVFYCAGAMAAGDPSATCASSKLSLVAKYGSCRLKADSKVIKGGGSLPGDYEKCSLAKFQDAEDKAASASGTCPTTTDESTVTTYMDNCTSRVATWLNGGGGLPDACPTDLATCQAGLVAPVSKTGQTTAYGAGSDGDFERGVARSFTDNGDGTVTDNKTGLMWEKKSDDGSIHDKDNTYTWGMTSPPYTMNGTMVTAFLATLNAGGGFAGHTDWRIPNLNELETLRNAETYSPATFTPFNNGCAASCTVTTCSCSQLSYYWSATTYAYEPNYAWSVRFVDGFPGADFKTNDNFVRAVRGGS